MKSPSSIPPNGESLPRFVLHGEGWEIIQRLVLRACFCSDMKEFDLA